MKKFFLFAVAAFFAANVMAQPTTAPAAPAQAADQVLSLYCTAYGSVMAPMGWGGGWEAIQVEGTDVLYFANGTWDCIGGEQMPQDATGFEYLHVDAWSTGDYVVAFTLESTSESGEPKTKYEGNQLKANEWVSFDLKMADCFPGVTGKAINYFIYETFSGEADKAPLALANIYFHHGATSAVENVATEKAHKMVENGQIVILKNGVRYNVLGAKL